MNKSNRQHGPSQTFFAEEDIQEWGPIVYAAACKRMTVSSIAGKFGAAYSTLTNNELGMNIVRQGWAKHDEEILDLLLDQARDQPSLYEPEERSQIRALKADAIKTIYKVLTRELPPTVQETERVRRLSDAELKTELAKAIDKRAKEAQ